MKNNYLAFQRQFTKWLPRQKLNSVIEDLQLEHHYQEGIDYFIKSNARKSNPKYAVYVRKENKFKRQMDRSLLNNFLYKNLSLLDLVTLNLPFKQSEISIFDTIEKRF